MAAVNSGPNRMLLVALRDVLDEFGRGTMTVEGVQTALQQTRPLLERDGTDVARAIDLAAADLETIRFTRLLHDQPAAATEPLGTLRAILEQSID